MSKKLQAELEDLASLILQKYNELESKYEELMSQSFFVTIYTDASVRPQKQEAQIAWICKCSEGKIQGYTDVPYDKNSTRIEMLAIFYAIKESLRHWPKLEGFFINSDNMGCVTSFWTFDPNRKIPESIKDIHAQIAEMTGTRWIRAKHVKAHTKGRDRRSYLNREVDSMTRRKKLV